MMDKVVIAGFGGQGVMFTGKLLAYTGMEAGLELCWIPSYGPEMRGGTANCMVLLADREIFSPVVDEADGAILLSEPAYQKFASRVRQTGALVANTSLVHPAESDLQRIRNPICLHATEMANSLGNPSVSNLVCLGALLPFLELINKEMMIQTLKKMMHKSPQVLRQNIEAIEKGMEAGQKR